MLIKYRLLRQSCMYKVFRPHFTAILRSRRSHTPSIPSAPSLLYKVSLILCRSRAWRRQAGWGRRRCTAHPARHVIIPSMVHGVIDSAGATVRALEKIPVCHNKIINTRRKGSKCFTNLCNVISIVHVDVKNLQHYN